MKIINKRNLFLICFFLIAFSNSHKTKSNAYTSNEYKENTQLKSGESSNKASTATTIKYRSPEIKQVLNNDSSSDSSSTAKKEDMAYSSSSDTIISNSEMDKSTSNYIKPKLQEKESANSNNLTNDSSSYSKSFTVSSNSSSDTTVKKFETPVYTKGKVKSSNSDSNTNSNFNNNNNSFTKVSTSSEAYGLKNVEAPVIIKKESEDKKTSSPISSNKSISDQTIINKNKKEDSSEDFLNAKFVEVQIKKVSDKNENSTSNNASNKEETAKTESNNSSTTKVKERSLEELTNAYAASIKEAMNSSNKNELSSLIKNSSSNNKKHKKSKSKKTKKNKLDNKIQNHENLNFIENTPQKEEASIKKFVGQFRNNKDADDMSSKLLNGVERLSSEIEELKFKVKDDEAELNELHVLATQINRIMKKYEKKASNDTHERSQHAPIKSEAEIKDLIKDKMHRQLQGIRTTPDEYKEISDYDMAQISNDIQGRFN